MLIYQSYIFNKIAKLFLITIITVTVVLWFGQIIKLSYCLKQGSGLLLFIKVALALFPIIIWPILPPITLISTIYCYYKLHTYNELLILSDCGVNKRQLMLPAINFSLIIMCISYFLGIYLLPKSNLFLKHTSYEIKHRYVNTYLLMSQNLTNLAEGLCIYMDETQKIVIIDLRQKSKVNVIKAKEFIKTNQMLSLYKGIEYIIDSNNEVVSYFDHIIINLNKLLSKFTAPYKKSIQEYYFWELDKTIHYIEIYQRLIWPLYCIILTVIGLSIFLKFQYITTYSCLISFIISLFSCYIHFYIYSYFHKHEHVNTFIYLIPIFWLLIGYILSI